MYLYPSFSWSKVSFLDKHLIIGVNLLPLSNKKTRWFITICHNYYKTEIGKEFMKSLALIILSQDFKQMKNQFPENDLKKEVLFDKTFKDEEVEKFLNGRNINQKHIVCIEGSSYSNIVKLVIDDPEKNKKYIKSEEYKPFVYVKDLKKLGIPFYKNRKEEQRCN
jgi:hypothetical protein